MAKEYRQNEGSLLPRAFYKQYNLDHKSLTNLSVVWTKKTKIFLWNAIIRLRWRLRLRETEIGRIVKLVTEAENARIAYGHTTSYVEK